MFNPKTQTGPDVKTPFFYKNYVQNVFRTIMALPNRKNSDKSYSRGEGDIEKSPIKNIDISGNLRYIIKFMMMIRK